MLRKSRPNFQHYVKKIEAKAKKGFSYEKTCITVISLKQFGDLLVFGNLFVLV